MQTLGKSPGAGMSKIPVEKTTCIDSQFNIKSLQYWMLEFIFRKLPQTEENFVTVTNYGFNEPISFLQNIQQQEDHTKKQLTYRILHHIPNENSIENESEKYI